MDRQHQYSDQNSQYYPQYQPHERPRGHTENSESSGMERRYQRSRTPSFDSGDDTTYFDRFKAQSKPGDELFYDPGFYNARPGHPEGVGARPPQDAPQPPYQASYQHQHQHQQHQYQQHQPQQFQQPQQVVSQPAQPLPPQPQLPPPPPLPSYQNQSPPPPLGGAVHPPRQAPQLRMPLPPLSVPLSLSTSPQHSAVARTMSIMTNLPPSSPGGYGGFSSYIPQSPIGNYPQHSVAYGSTPYGGPMSANWPSANIPQAVSQPAPYNPAAYSSHQPPPPPPKRPTPQSGAMQYQSAAQPNNPLPPPPPPPPHQQHPQTLAYSTEEQQVNRPHFNVGNLQPPGNTSPPAQHIATFQQPQQGYFQHQSSPPAGSYGTQSLPFPAPPPPPQQQQQTFPSISTVQRQQSLSRPHDGRAATGGPQHQYYSQNYNHPGTGATDNTSVPLGTPDDTTGLSGTYSVANVNSAHSAVGLQRTTSTVYSQSSDSVTSAADPINPLPTPPVPPGQPPQTTPDAGASYRQNRPYSISQQADLRSVSPQHRGLYYAQNETYDRLADATSNRSGDGQQNGLYAQNNRDSSQDALRQPQRRNETPEDRTVGSISQIGNSTVSRNSNGNSAYHMGQPGNSSDEAAAAWEAMRAEELRELRISEENEKRHKKSTPENDGDALGDSDTGYFMDVTSYSGGAMPFFDDGHALPTFQEAGHDHNAPVLPGHALSHVTVGGLEVNNNIGHPISSPRSADSESSAMGMSDYPYPDPYIDILHPFPAFESAARTDASGTGGLLEPGRRNSFVEGDEYEGLSSAGRKPSAADEMDDESDDDGYAQFLPDLSFYPPESIQNYHSAGLNSHPLPPIPQDQRAAGDSRDPSARFSQVTGNYRPAADRHQSVPDGTSTAQGLSTAQEGRLQASLSLNSHTSSSRLYLPRSKTDASAQSKPHGARPPAPRPVSAQVPAASHGTQNYEDETLALDLPSIPLKNSRKFDATKIPPREIRKCQEPWALSKVFTWLKGLTEGEEFLREKSIVEAIVALFTHMVPTMNVADAETIAARAVKTLWDSEALTRDEEWVKWNPSAEVCGVIFQVSGSGCYAPRLHATKPDEPEVAGRCYSHHCARTLKKISIGAQFEDRERKKEDWATFWKLKAEDVEGYSRKEIERENNLHEIVQTEQEFLDHMNVLRVVYKEQLIATQKSHMQVIKPAKFENFVREVFGKAEAVEKVNEQYLLPELQYRQMEQGPWVVGFSDIFREWIRKARPAYIEYAASFPKADLYVRREAERNMLFRQFLEQCRQDPRANRLDWQHFLKAPITRLQRYGLLLSTVLKHSEKEGDEKQSLQAAIEEIKAVTLECDSRVDEMTKQVVLIELATKLKMRPGMEVNLRLDEKGREVIYRGDLQRSGNNKFTWLDTHAILFDHYLVLAKTVYQKDAGTGSKKTKHEKYDVSRMPIPMDLLVLENTGDEAPVVKNAVKGLALGTATSKVQPSPAAASRTGSLASTATPGNLQHTLSSGSTASNLTIPPKTTNSQPLENANEKVMYPFRIKHLGKGRKGEENVYTLYAPTASARNDWCAKIILAKERHAASLFRQNAEPFRLRVMSDVSFGFDGVTSSASPKLVNVRGTPLDRAIKEVEGMFPGPKPAVVCKSTVNCATAFQVGMGYGKQMVAIGTDTGVYVSDYTNPRGWAKAINISRVTQIAVLEDFSLFLVLADKSLIAYHLDSVVPPAQGTVISESAKRPPQKLSGARDVGFFATGRMKERILVFYKKREGLSSTFKVLEPVFQKATEKRSRFSRKGSTEFFRDFDDFYIPTDCFGINLFHSSLAIQTSKGFEVMTLDKKQPWSIPELKAPHVVAIANRVKEQRPLGMFRLSDIEFLLCYEECGVFVNKHGDVSRSVTMEFVGKAKTCAHYPPYVLIFDADFVEIRNADNGRLRQVIAGREIRCLDDGQSGGSAGHRTIKVGMVHPETDGRMVVVELLLNEGQRD